MGSKNLIGVLLDEELDQSVGVVVRLCSRVGDHGEGSDLVGDALGLELLLGLSDPCDLEERGKSEHCVADYGDSYEM